MIVLTAVFALVMLSNCSDEALPNEAVESPSEAVSDAVVNAPSANSRADKFLENFTHEHPDFELMDYVVGSDENSPIQLAVVAMDKQSGSSSTLFIVDPNGVGQVVLASDSFALYRKEDGITLDENKILFSLDIRRSSFDYEIHDYELVVTQEEYQGVSGMVYSNNESIREN